MKQPAKWWRAFLPLASAGRRSYRALAACLARSPRRSCFSWTTPPGFRVTPKPAGNEAANAARVELGARAVFARVAGAGVSPIGLNIIGLDSACPLASNGRRQAGPLNHQRKFTVK
jgi:hypothetical protein